MREDVPASNISFDGTKLILVGGSFLLLPIIALLFWYWTLLQLVITILFIVAIGVGTLTATLFIVGLTARTAQQCFKAGTAYQQLRRNAIENQNLERVPELIQYALSHNLNVKFKGVEITDWKSNMHTLGGTRNDLKMLEAPSEAPGVSIPSTIFYEDIAPRIPEGHTLIGVIEEGEIVSRPDDVTYMLWVVGSPGTGKTTTTSFRIKDKVERGHKLIICDPHIFKPDSLYNAVKHLESEFVLPIASTTQEITHSLTHWLDKFEERKRGIVHPPYEKITLIVDELNGFNDPDNEEEKVLLDKLKRCVRIAGSESRNFEMHVIGISQWATGLPWVRKAASTVIAHAVNNFNERVYACNDDRKVARSMDNWPKGRTFVYGSCFQETGPIVCQQPVLRGKAEESRRAPTYEEFEDYWYTHCNETGEAPKVREIEAYFNCTNHRARQLRNELLGTQGE